MSEILGTVIIKTQLWGVSPIVQQCRTYGMMIDIISHMFSNGVWNSTLFIILNWNLFTHPAMKDSHWLGAYTNLENIDQNFYHEAHMLQVTRA